MFIRDFGTSQVLIAWFQNSKKDETSKSQAFFTTGIMSLVSAVLFIVYTLTVRSNHPNQDMMWILLFGIIFNPGMFDWFFLTTNKWSILFATRATQTALYAFGVYYVLNHTSEQKLDDVVNFMALSYMASFAVATWFFKITNVKIKAYWREFKDIIHQSIPMALGGILGFFFLPLGFFMIDYGYSGEEVVGIYNTSHRLMIIASMLLGNFITSGLVNYKSGDGISLKNSMFFAAIIWIPGFLLVFFLGKEILNVLFYGIEWTESNLEWAHFNLIALSFSILFQAARNDLITWLINMRKTWVYLRHLTVAAVMNVTIGALILHFDVSQWMAVGILMGDLTLTITLIIGFKFQQNFLKN